MRKTQCASFGWRTERTCCAELSGQKLFASGRAAAVEVLASCTIRDVLLMLATQNVCAMPTTTASWFAPVATGVVEPVALKADFVLLMTYVTSAYSVVRLDNK
ncbi:hypothetical protein B0G75_103566 [Paraburkholderia sp. BL18I3N2]|nr:hypothetical protein B0G75_103566 [Paraburkholderia sp. BL18I3N2]